MNTTPQSHPYVVRTVYQTSTPGCHGWADRTRSYVSWMEARWNLVRPLGRGEISREMFEWRGRDLVSAGVKRRKKT